MKKTVFILPGYRQRPTNKAYKELARMLKIEGYSPILMNIPWQTSSFLQNTDYFVSQYKKIRREKKYILGFSFGAMLAFVASTKVSSQGLILCSLSPYFKEDLPKDLLDYYEDFSKIRCQTLAKKLKAKQVLMLYGTREAPKLKKRVSLAYNQISKKNKSLISVSKTEHNIGDRRYLRTIRLATKELIN